MKPLYLIVAAILIAVIVGAGGFYGGMVYAQSQAASQVAAFQRQRAAGQVPNGQNPQGAPGSAGQFRGANSQLGAPVAIGQVKSVNGNTVEISTAQSVVTVKVNDSTVISKTDRGTVSDLQVGDRVTVFSKETGDTPTASGIQIQAIVPTPQP